MNALDAQAERYETRIAELEAVIKQIAAFADTATPENWRDIILHIERQCSGQLDKN